MAQVSYGTITITDTNDIESIVVEYNRNQSTTTPPEQNDLGWSTTRPAWASGYYIWQRTRTHKSGTQATSDIIGNAVCITGATGQKGDALEISSVKYAISEENSFIDEEPYTFRSSLEGNRLKDMLVGGTVAWNQLISFAKIRETRTIQGVQFTNNNNGTITLSGTATGTVNGGEWNVLGLPTDHVCLYTFIDTDSKLKWTMGKYPSNASDQGTIKIVSGNTYNITFYPQSFDLTQMFGSTIADYIYSLETANAGAGVAWFRKLFPKPYYAYNAGELKHVEGVSSHDMVRFNAWDEEWELGGFNTNSGEKDASTNRIRSKNFIPCLPNTTYFFKHGTLAGNVLEYDSEKTFIKTNSSPTTFTTSANTCFLAFYMGSEYGATYKNDICINLHWDGERDGEYEAYVKHSYPLDSSLTLRGIPKLDASNNLYYDGDTYESDGTVTRKYGIVDLGTLAWTYNSTNEIFTSSVISDFKQLGTYYLPINMVCAKYVTGTVNSQPQTNKEICTPKDSQVVRIKDLSYSDASAFTTAMSGVYLVYELATPTAESADPYTNPQIVDDFGTEEYVTTSIVPVGHNTEYFTGTTDQPADSDFTYDEPPNVKDGQWLWVRTTYSDNTKVYLKTRQGAEGLPGTAGRGITDIETLYATNNSTTTAPTSGWQTQPPTYDSSKPKYWVKVTTIYDSGDPTIVTYLDNGITDAMSTAAAANSTANTANQIANTANSTANTANQTANQANTTASEAKTIAEGASSAISDLNQYFWRQKTAATNVPAGSYVTNVPGTTYKNNPASGGFNSLVQATGIFLRNGITTLSSWTGDALTFNNPSTGNAQLIIGANGTLQSGNYTRGSDSKFSSNGTKIDLINGDIITKYFRVSQGLESGLNAGVYVHGTIEALDGRIGTGYTPAGGIETNYWEIGNYDDYNLHNTAKIIGHGSSFIQLGDASTWRLSTNRIHTGWYSDNDTVLHYPQDSNNKYWDFGIHAPYSDSPSGRGNDKFIYIRTQKAANNSLENLLYDLNDNYSTQQWDYKFWIDAEGKVHAQNFYIGNSTTPIGGGVGTTAEKIINSDGTYGKGSTTQPIYLDSNGRPATTTYALNAAGAKGVDTSISATSTSTNLPTSQAVAAFVEGKGYITSYTDNKVQTSQANTTKVFLAGTSTTGTSTGTLNFDSNVYLTTTAGTLHATTFEGNLSGTASRATADADGNTIKTTYLKLTGGNVTGAVSFGSSVSADELTAGDLVVNGAASFTNNLQANTINGVAVGSSPKFTDTVTTITVTGNGNAITSMTASNGAITATKGSTFLTSYTETDPIFVASAAHSITSNDISNWNSKTSNTGTVTSVRVQASSPLTSTTSTASNTTLNTTIKFSNQNKNLVLAGPSSGDAAAPTFRSLVAADIPGLAWSKITSGKPTTLSGYGITDAVPSSRKVAGHALTSDVTISNSDVGLGNVINAKQITNITNEFKDGQNTGKLVIWRGESDSEVLEVQITAREATSATNATNAQYATYDASEASKTTKTTIANKYIAKSVGTKKGDIIYWSGSGTPVRLEAGTNGQVLKLANGVPTWGTDNNDNTWRAIQVNGTDILGTGTSTGKLNLKAGSNVTITNDSGTVTIASSYTNTDTKVNMKARGTTKAYLLGTTTAPTSSNQAVESVAETGVYFDTTAAKLVATTFSGALTGNASSATEFSSNATVTLTGDTTGISAGSKKSWSIATTNSYITSLGRAASADYLTPSYLSKVHFCLASSSMTTHKPPAGDGYITTYHWDNSGWAAQFYLRHNKDNPAPMVRGATSTDNTSDWGEWKYILTEVNYTDYTVKKDGTGASGNWGISISGNATTATSATTATTATYSYYPKIVASNEIRFDVATKPSSATDLYFGYAWSDGSKDAKINNYVFDNGNSALAGIKAANFNGYTIASSIPSGAVFTDTKNTAGSTNTDSALFLIGATSQAANPQTYSHDTVKINTTGQIISTGYEMTTSSSMSNAKCQMRYEDSLQAIVFSFA